VPAKFLAPRPRQRVIARSRGVLAAAAVVFGLLLVSSDRMQAVRAAERARAIEADDRAFCSKLGIQSHAPLYPECRAGLREIRLRHQQRTADFFY
jgi:hypothetical protein